jgi:DNA recombination-dependent growth factor C
MADEIREFLYHNKQQTSMATSWPIKFHTASKLGVKRKSNNDALNKNNEKN